MHYLYLIKMNTQQPFHPTHPTNEPSLTKEQVEAAKDELVRDVKEFPRINRRFVDPHKPGDPKFALFSYIEYQDVDMLNFFEVKIMHRPLQRNDRRLRNQDHSCLKPVYLWLHFDMRCRIELLVGCSAKEKM